MMEGSQWQNHTFAHGQTVITRMRRNCTQGVILQMKNNQQRIGWYNKVNEYRSQKEKGARQGASTYQTKVLHLYCDDAVDEQSDTKEASGEGGERRRNKQSPKLESRTR